MNEIRLLFDRAVHSAEDRRYEAALLGALDGSSINVPGRTGYVYARRGPNGELGEIIAKNTKVAVAYGLPVKMRLEAGQWVIREAEGQFSDPDVDPGSSGVYPHASTHQHGGSDEVGTATPGANAVIKADADGKIGAGWIDDADIDHGSIGGLADDDHTQYHNDTRGDLRYAPIAKGVTNGDSHDHSGGDGAQIDHGSIAGLSDDDHAQYALLAGRSGGQTAYGGTAAGDDLTLSSTANATKGTVTVGTALTVDEVNSRVGIGDTTPDYTLDVVGSGSFSSGLYRGDAAIHILESRTLPTVVDDYIELGNITLGIQGCTLIISVADASFTVTKHYLIAASYDETVDSSTFWTVLPIWDTGSFSGNNFALDMAVNNSNAYFRLRRTAGSTAGTARVLILNAYGTFTASSTTGSMTAPTLVFGSYTSIDRAMFMTTLRALSSGGLTITDDGANLGLIVLDGGVVVVGLTTTGANVLGMKAGTSTNDAAVGGVLYVTTTQAGNVGTGEDDLASYSVPANTLAVNNQSLWFEAWGTLAANTNNKQVRVRFGTSGTNLTVDPGVTASGSGTWHIRGRIYRTGAATQKGYGFSSINNSVSSSTALDQTLSGAVTLKVTGEATSNNDIVLESFIVGWDDANT